MGALQMPNLNFINQADPFAQYPRYVTIAGWCQLSGMGRTSTYAALGRGDLRAIKAGTRTLIDVQRGLAWLETLPAAIIRVGQ
jgi:hypothetical protein